jgi:glutaconyl-CoA/methylmalonyl-CoA decarboxylase subunit gamma
MRYELKIGARDFTVEVDEQKADLLRVSVNGTAYDVEVRSNVTPLPHVPVAEATRHPTADIAVPPAATGPAAKPAAGQEDILAPIPGLIVEIIVHVGDKVQAGQSVAVMEAMKMENNLSTHVSGIVKEILVQKGSEVATGDVILRIGPA